MISYTLSAPLIVLPSHLSPDQYQPYFNIGENTNSILTESVRLITP